MGIEVITLLIVGGLFSLMAIGVPLGAATLLISVTTALLNFGPPGLILVSSNVVHVFDKYTLVAIPFFVFMANILERSGVAKDLFESMAILGGRNCFASDTTASCRSVPSRHPAPWRRLSRPVSC